MDSEVFVDEIEVSTCYLQHPAFSPALPEAASCPQSEIHQAWRRGGSSSSSRARSVGHIFSRDRSVDEEAQMTDWVVVEAPTTEPPSSRDLAAAAAVVTGAAGLIFIGPVAGAALAVGAARAATTDGSKLNV